MPNDLREDRADDGMRIKDNLVLSAKLIGHLELEV